MSFYTLLIHIMFWSGVIITLIGLVILSMPGLALKLSIRLNTWIDTDKWFLALDRSQSSERIFYRHHRLFGALITAGSLFIFYTFVIRYSGDALKIKSIVLYSEATTEWLISSAIFFISLASVIFLVFGLLILIRPSSLKRIEKDMNQWIDTTTQSALNRQHQGADNYFSKHPRFVGTAVLLGGIYLWLSSAILLLK